MLYYLTLTSHIYLYDYQMVAHVNVKYLLNVSI